MIVESRWGPCSFIDKDMYVGRSLFHYGEYNPDETEFVLSLYKGGLMLDIGANFGVIGMAVEANGGTVEYFEPQPWVFEHLRKNVKGKCHALGLGSRTEVVQMPRLFGDKQNYGGFGIGSKSPTGAYIDVNVVPLDSFNYDNVTLMKIDVEGYEESVLRGAVELIARCRPIMYIEDDRPLKSASLRAFIRSLGYSITEHNPPLYREKNHFGLKRNIFDKNYVSQNIVCLPC